MNLKGLRKFSFKTDANVLNYLSYLNPLRKTLTWIKEKSKRHLSCRKKTCFLLDETDHFFFLSKILMQVKILGGRVIYNVEECRADNSVISYIG